MGEITKKESEYPNRPPAPWKDESSYALGERGKIPPRTWRVQFGKFTLVVTRHIDYPPDVWVSHCHGLWSPREMKSRDVREAACQAKAMLQVELERALREILEGDTAPQIPPPKLTLKTPNYGHN